MKVAVIGGGPAGLMAAGSINSGDVVLLERNEKAGKKLYITGKGRCNFTNSAAPDEFLKNVVSNPKFLYSAIYGFTPQDTVEFFQNAGLSVKTERGGRVFPLSDKASDVTKALVNNALDGGVRFEYGFDVDRIEWRESGFVISAKDGRTEQADRVILATGGKSYPSTGSDGTGYSLAKRLGHTVVEPKPALTAIELCEDIGKIEGLSLKNVTASVNVNGTEYSQFGEMLFTSRGVSGPIILTLSSLIARGNVQGAKLLIDLKPKLDFESLDKRILRDFETVKNKQLKNALDELLPKSLIPYIIEYSGLNPEKPVNSVSKEERRWLAKTLKELKLTISGLCGFNEAIVTSGGIKAQEINSSTMESKVVPGLFFAGEVIDIDALTGGYNIQIALSTGRLAARTISGG